MTNITELIEKTSERYAPKEVIIGKPYMVQYSLNDIATMERAAFTAGASFATTDSEMMKAMLKPFGDWLWRSYKQIDAQVWKERWTTSDTVYTLYQVIDKYIQFIIDNGK